jgi:transposase InsO family protein
VKFAFIRDHLQADYDLTMACRVLKVSRSGYYAWSCRGPSRRQHRRQGLAIKIHALHGENRKLYGSPRICAALNACGQKACVNTVADVMRQEGLRARVKRRFVPRTTDSCHSQPVAGNLLDRQFTTPAANRAWVADITYIRTDAGWLYLAGVMDLYSRRIVGWSMADHMETQLVSDALEMAIRRRRPCAGLVHHSDRGVQYASDAYRGRLEQHGIRISMSRRGDCYDNAAMESFWSTLKTELVHIEHYVSREQARRSIFEYIEVFYNRKRLHSSLGYVSPEVFEAATN